MKGAEKLIEHEGITRYHPPRMMANYSIKYIVLLLYVLLLKSCKVSLPGVSVVELKIETKFLG